MRTLMRLTIMSLAALVSVCTLDACSSLAPSATTTSLRQPYHERIAIGGRFSVSYQQEGKPGFIVSNGIFETTRQNLTQAGFQVRDFPVGQERSSATVESDSLEANGFDGDMDLGKLR